jgi:hypothetical protein
MLLRIVSKESGSELDLEVVIVETGPEEAKAAEGSRDRLDSLSELWVVGSK